MSEACCGVNLTDNVAVRIGKDIEPTGIWLLSFAKEQKCAGNNKEFWSVVKPLFSQKCPEECEIWK